MGIWNNVVSLFERKASAAGLVVSQMQTPGKPIWSKRDYENFAKEAYQQNAIAFRCMAMVAQAAGSVPHLLRNGDDKEASNPKLEALLRRPAPGQTLPQLIESMATYLQIAGQAYVEGVGPDRADAPPLELWSLRPDRMKIVAGNMGLPGAYVYSAAGREARWDVDPITGRSNILHIKRFHPTDDWYGLSQVEPAAFAINRHNEAGAHNMAVLQNGATPSGMLVFKPIIIDGQPVSAPAEVIQEAEKRLEQRYSGARNAGRPMTGSGDIDWKSFGMTMEQLQLTESKLDAARDICAAFGVPIELLLPGQSTYNNKAEAKLALYEETVLPLVEMIFEQLSGWLLPRFQDGLVIEPNYDEIEALGPRREKRQATTRELWNDGLILWDEAREALQFEPKSDMPQKKLDSGLLTALINGAEKDPALHEPLFRYMKSVGLVASDADYDQFVLASNVNDSADTGAALDAVTPPAK